MLQHDEGLQSNGNMLTIEAMRAALILLRTCRFSRREWCPVTGMGPDDCELMRDVSGSPRRAPSREVFPGMSP